VMLEPLTGFVTVNRPEPTLAWADQVIVPATVVLELEMPVATIVVALMTAVPLPGPFGIVEETVSVGPEAVMAAVIFEGTNGIPALVPFAEPEMVKLIGPGAVVKPSGCEEVAVALVRTELLPPMPVDSIPEDVIVVLRADVNVALADAGMVPPPMEPVVPAGDASLSDKETLKPIEA
jgi:hypothetical protein